MTVELIGQVVSVHLNLHKNRWAIARKPRHSPLLYAVDVTLEDVTFKISETQRQRCIAVGARCVHAWAIGTLVAIDTEPDISTATRVTYNPFTAATFHVVGRTTKVHTTPRAHFVDRHVFIEHQPTSAKPQVVTP